MRTLKYSPTIITLFVISAALFLNGCYTQFSRPDVATEYYAQEEETYRAQDVEETETRDVYIDRYNIYLYGGPPVYFGPHVWAYWSPYHRWHQYTGYYDPEWYDYNYYPGYA